MLTQQKNRNDFLVELKRDSAWALQRKGLWGKYYSKLASKEYRHGDFVGWVKYTTPSKNIVHIGSVKNTYGGYVILSHVLLFEYKGGYLTPYFADIRAELGISGHIFFTRHCIDRIKERAGLDFFEAYERSCKSTEAISYSDYSDYGYNGNEACLPFGDGFCICTKDYLGNEVAITYINNSQAYSNQLQKELEAKLASAKFADEKAKANDELLTAAFIPRRERRRLLRE